MRICLVSHQFLPEHKAGVEVYVHRVAQALEAAGHDVIVYATRKDLTRREGDVFEEVVDGVRVRRVVRNLFHKSFTHTFRNAAAEDDFARAVLDDFNPDLIHVHHLMHHSVGLPERAKQQGVPVVMTLHDYWFECPKFGLLLGYDGAICETVDVGRCSRCLPTFRWRNPTVVKPIAAGLRGLRRGLGLNAQRPLQRIYRRFAPAGGTSESRAAPPADPVLERELSERRSDILDRLGGSVDLFFAPSRFLGARAAAFGLPSDRIVHMPNGVPRPGSDWARLPRSGPLRFAYCGSVLPHKGVDYLLDAYAGLIERRGRDCASLSIHGGWDSNPSYGKRIRRRGAAIGADVTGAYAQSELDGFLARCDVLVVPSVWYENQPITILDAQVRGIPSLVTDLGALVELVPDPARRFRVADSASLTGAMERALDGLAGPEARLPPTPAEDVEKALKHYDDLVR